MWPSGALALGVALCVAASVRAAAPASFAFTSFLGALDSTIITQGGSVGLDGTNLLLTSQSGANNAAWYYQQVLVSGFEVTFDFQTGYTANNSSEGVAFVIQNSGTEALGGRFEQLGYGTIGNGIALEIDCIANALTDTYNGSLVRAPHLSLHLPDSHGGILNATERATDVRFTQTSLTACGQRQTVTITYDPAPGTPNNLVVAAFGVPDAIVIQNFNLLQYISFGSNNLAYVGFTATTSGSSDPAQKVFNWSFKYLGKGGANSILSGQTTSGTAGIPLSFTVIAVDQYGNNMIVGGDVVTVAFSPAASTQSSIVDNNDGSYTVTYSATFATQYALTIQINGQVVQGGGPLNVQINPDVPANSLVIMSPPSTTTAGTPLTVELQAYDQYNNVITSGSVASSFTYTFSGPEVGNDDVTGPVTDIGQGKVRISFTGTKKQAYRLTVLVDGSMVPSFPKTITVTPASASASSSLVTGVVQAGNSVVAGLPVNIIVNAMDQYKNAIDTGGDNFVVTALPQVNSTTIAATDHLNGQYSFLVTITKADSFMLGVLLSNADVANSPYPITVQPTDPSAGACIATGGGLSSAVAGVPSLVNVQVVDDFNNLYKTSPPTTFQLVLQVTGPSAATTSQVDNKDGTITLVYDVTTSGTYQVSVTSGGVNVVGSPSRSIVYSAPADPVKSSVPAMYQDQFVSAKSGRVVFFLVQAVDQYGNVATTGGDSVVVNVVNDNSGSTQAKIVPTVVDTNNGTYSVSFVPTDDQAGSYKIYIDISGTPLVGTPYDLNVQGPDNTNTIIWAVMIPIVVIAIIVLVGLYYMRRRKRSNHYMLVEQDPDSILPSINSGKIASTAKYSLLPE